MTGPVLTKTEQKFFKIKKHNFIKENINQENQDKENVTPKNI